jgi:hypothetical protein
MSIKINYFEDRISIIKETVMLLHSKRDIIVT